MGAFLKKTLYRLEPGIRIPGQPTSFNINSVIFKEFVNEDVQRVDPINSNGGASLNGFPWLYSKITFVRSALTQEMYCLNTIASLLNELIGIPSNAVLYNDGSQVYYSDSTPLTYV